MSELNSATRCSDWQRVGGKRYAKRMLLAVVLTAVLHPLQPSSAEVPGVINRILDEGFNHSELPRTAAYLTDRIGGRLTNSPQMRMAERWVQETFSGWGLKNVRADGFEFGRGWSIEDSSVKLIVPRVVRYRAIPIAWTPATNGNINAPAIVAPMSHTRDFERWRGKLRGKIVLVAAPTAAATTSEPVIQRFSAAELSALDAYQPPMLELPKRVRDWMRTIAFESERDTFLAEEGALAWARPAAIEGGLLGGEGYGHQRGRTPRLPGFEIALEDYRQIARLAKADTRPMLEVMSAVRFHDDDVNAYNILADIPGRDARAGYVMAGAHLDSWVASDGAADNAAGCAIVMEAARILAKLGVPPKRTIRFALWAAEEQGLLGSIDYVQRYVASRPPLTDPQQAKIMPHFTWDTRWPIQPGADHARLAAYFNLDNGSGKVRGVYAEGNVAIIPILQQWLAPFASMGASTVAASRANGTDHVPMDRVGVPAFQFIQDPLDYVTRIHHTTIDTYDHLQIADLKQAAVILASLLFQAADHPEPLPRKSLPTRPAPADPFSYDDSSEEGS